MREPEVNALAAQLLHPQLLHIASRLAVRERYRYVQPVVVPAENGWRIVSPCCSRNVDPEGGTIDIAWLESVDGGWVVHARDHAQQRWFEFARTGDLESALDHVLRDPRRVFWP